jgi:hypothetical protein
MGMDVFQVAGDPPRMAGQIILSMPGGPCMRCLGFITDENLAAEGTRYGDAGGRPQVVWANGILASAVVGVVVDLLTDWTKSIRRVVFLSYDGNANELKPDVRLKYFASSRCVHFDYHEVGDPTFKVA